MNETRKNKKTSTGTNFADICKEVRKKSGFTKEQMAKYLGVTVRTYERYETGQVNPGAEPAFRLAGFYIVFLSSSQCLKKQDE